MTDKPSKYANVCPFCERPAAQDADYKKWDDAPYIDDKYDKKSSEVETWADTLCWFGWEEPGGCRQGTGKATTVEDRLIEVLDERDAALAEVERLCAAINESCAALVNEDHATILRRNLAELRDEVSRLRAALEAVEWMEDQDAFFCPWCGRFQGDGHRPDCQRQLALGLAVV